MKNITQKIKVAAVIAAVTLLSGCLDGSHYYDTLSDLELQTLYEGRMFRGYVDQIAPDDKFAELLKNYPYSDGQFFDIWGMSKEEAANRQYIIIAWHSSPGLMRRSTALVERKWNLSKGDIIDYKAEKVNRSDLLQRKKTSAAEITFIGSIPIFREKEGAVIEEPNIVLGIVCRGSRPDCLYNGTPETTLGIGRVLASTDDYRGAEAESQQELFILGTNFGAY